MIIMRKNVFNKNLISFIQKSSCSFTCTKEIINRLSSLDFKELNESDNWKNIPNKFFIVRNDTSIIAIELPKNKTDVFSIITTHLDTPALLLKPSAAYIKDNYLKYNVMPYGGLLNMGWLDHPLSIAGRIIIKEKNVLKRKIVDYRLPLLIVPSVAIHQNDKANSNLDLNMQIDLQPIMSISNNKGDWFKLLNKLDENNIIDYDLYAYNPVKPVLIGKNQELLVSPRIDNITSVFAALESFINSKSSFIKVFCAFNNEEIGSLTEEGADSNFLIDILKRICARANIDLASSLAKSFIISSDNTHAIHPNRAEYADDTGVSYLNQGFTIVKEEASTTNALSASIIKEICNKYKIKYQIATAKNDLTGGSTLSGISLRHVSILSIDVGISQLSMHSSIETCSINDVYELYKMMYYFYKTKIIRKKETIFLEY